MEGKSVAKVGFLVLVATVLAVVGYFYLSHQQLNTYLVKVHFKDTKGLLRQSIVRLKGVGIGEVKSVQLEQTGGTTTPTVELTIDKKYSIPRNYRFVIVSGLLISNPTIDVRAPEATGGTLVADAAALSKDNEEVVEGSEAGSALDNIDPQLTKTIGKFNASFDNINARLDKSFARLDTLLIQTNKLVGNSNETITAAKSLIANPQFKNDLLETTSNFKQLSVDSRRTVKDLSQNLKGLSQNLSGILKDNRPKLDKLTDQGLALVSKLGESIDNVNLVVKKLTDQVSDPRLQSSLQETIELARSTLSSTRQIASDVHQLTGDPTLQANLKESAANLKLTTERSAEAVGRLNNLLEKISGAANKVHAPKAPPVQLLVEAQEAVNPAHFRLDLDARVPLGQRNLLDLGLYDLGGDTRLNLQGGARLSDSFLARYGLHASKLGVGLEYGKYPYSGLRMDLYDANHPRLDVRGLIRVNKNASIWAGADGILRGDPVPTIGVQLNN